MVNGTSSRSPQVHEFTFSEQGYYIVQGDYYQGRNGHLTDTYRYRIYPTTSPETEGRWRAKKFRAIKLLVIAEVVGLCVVACWLKLYWSQAVFSFCARSRCLKKSWADSSELTTWSRYLVSLISKASRQKNFTRSDYHFLSWFCWRKIANVNSQRSVVVTYIPCSCSFFLASSPR